MKVIDKVGWCSLGYFCVCLIVCWKDFFWFLYAPRPVPGHVYTGDPYAGISYLFILITLPLVRWLFKMFLLERIERVQPPALSSFLSFAAGVFGLAVILGIPKFIIEVVLGQS